jgi:quinoprotein glucose dehydrogenase
MHRLLILVIALLLCGLTTWFVLWEAPPEQSSSLAQPYAPLIAPASNEAAVPPEQSASPAPLYSPLIAPASNEAAIALQRIRVPPGLQVDLFAAEPLLANPVCFCVDEQNRFYVAETFRLFAGVTDIRNHMDWLDDDLASRTVADRLAMYKKRLGPNLDSYAVEHERIRLLEDTKGTGKADRSKVFADGFYQLADGVGAGLLARRGQVWYTCIPNLWLLRDTQGTGKADVRKSLHTGYGVHVGYLGHDLHGLRMGPDGKLYFTSGDRGFQVQTEGRTVASPDTGAVLRCNPDGSELEIVAAGLRNPQELAFDQYGNLFTGDNNADHGDKARWVYVVEGGDSGWRIGYQFMDVPAALGPWNAEKLWHLPYSGQAAYIVPPIAHIADGPAGVAYYPGLGLPERYQGHFFLCDFRGGSSASGIRSFAVRPRGASFETVDQHEFVWSVLATDVDFGMDCNLYLTDWVEGWYKPNKGRIYKVFDPVRSKDPVVQSVKKLMAEGMRHRPVAELAKLLEHPDMRVRQEAQFALAEKGLNALPTLAGVARGHPNQLARLHAVWGLRQLGRQIPGAWQPILALLADQDAEVRAQAAKVLGDGRVAAAYHPLLPRLKDPEARVRFFATMSLGKLGKKEAVGPIVQMLRENADQDAYLRHAGVMALTWIHDPEGLLAAAQDSSPAVRLAVLLVLRRWENPEVARYLNDAEPSLVLEAARAINDVPITPAFPKLAALIQRSGLSEPLGYRVLNANFRLGGPAQAADVARLAARADVPEALRIEALRQLADWTQPSGRDRIVGLWRPLPARPAHWAVDALRPALGGILHAPDQVRQEGALLAAKFGMKEAGPLLLPLATDPKQSAQVRMEALKSLEALKDQGLTQAVQAALSDADAKLRTAGRRILVSLDPVQGLAALKAVLDQGTIIERQGALSILGAMNAPEADALLAAWLDKLLAGQVSPDIQLDLLEAASQRAATAIKDRLARYEAARPPNDPLARHREALNGGDAEAGRRIFFHKAEVSCQRCHKINGEGGEVGPDLTGVGARQKREYLLEAIVDPNKEIAKGFETVVLALTNGQIQTGIVKAESDKEVRLMTAEGKVVAVAKKEIEERQRGKSAMPEDLMKFLSKAELRDLVEFLASLK